MKKVEVSQQLLARTADALDEIEQEVLGKLPRVRSEIRAGACPPGSCPVPHYGVPPETS